MNPRVLLLLSLSLASFLRAPNKQASPQAAGFGVDVAVAVAVAGASEGAGLQFIYPPTTP